MIHKLLRRWRHGYYRPCIHRSRLLGLPCYRGQTYDGLCPRHLGVVTAQRCDVCLLPDPYQGQGDGLSSCDCPRCEGGCGLADGSGLCTCPGESPDLPPWPPGTILEDQ